MSIVSLSSTNPNLSYIIQKNPQSGMKFQSIRLGVAAGWFSKNDSSYNIYFKDADDEVSYKRYPDEQFEYLDMTRYNSSMFVVNSIDEFFRSAYKKQNELDDASGFESCFLINMIQIKNQRYIKIFTEHFEEYKLECEQIIANNYRVTIKTDKSIFELLNFTTLFATFIAITNDENLHIQEENIEKNLKCLNIIDAPYFVRYLFKTRFLISENKFKNFKELLEKTDKSKISLTFGDNWNARQEYVQRNISSNHNILDIGCGEGKYITRLSKNIGLKKYYAIDVDPYSLEVSKKKVTNKNLDNVEFFDSITTYLQTHANESVDVILTEVVEHMDKESAIELITTIIDRVNFNKIIITTPDSRFNKNYFITEGFRHDDHKWEANKEEFVEIISESINNSNCEHTLEILFENVGDIVDEIATTQACVIINADK